MRLSILIINIDCIHGSLEDIRTKAARNENAIVKDIFTHPVP